MIDTGRFAERWRGIPGHHYEHGFDLQLRPERLELPLHWWQPRRIFVDSMGDLFHGRIPDEYVRQVFAVMERAPRPDWQTSLGAGPLSVDPGRLLLGIAASCPIHALLAENSRRWECKATPGHEAGMRTIRRRPDGEPPSARAKEGLPARERLGAGRPPGGRPLAD